MLLLVVALLLTRWVFASSWRHTSRLPPRACSHVRHTHTPTIIQPSANTPPTQVLSSNGGDDAALLRCLIPAVPPVEGAACTINGRAGRLFAEKGFVPDREVLQKRQGEEDDEPVAVLPFGVEVGAYAVGGNEVGGGGFLWGCYFIFVVSVCCVTD